MSRIEKIILMLPEIEGKINIVDKSLGVEVQIYKVYEWLWRIELKSIARENLLKLKEVIERSKS